MYQNSFLDTVKGQEVVDAIISISKSLKTIAETKKRGNTLDAQTIEKIYRKKEHQYLLEDAHRQYVLYIFDDEDVSEEKIEESLKNLKEQYGNNIFERFVAEFEDIQDCNIADNDTWHTAIQNTLTA